MRVTTLLEAREFAQAENGILYMAGSSIENARRIVEKRGHNMTPFRQAFRTLEDQFIRRNRLIDAIDKRLEGAFIVDLRKPLDGVEVGQ